MSTRILLLAAKDTIAYQPTRSAVATGTDLLAAVAPRLPAAAEVSAEDVDAGPSWDITPATMLTLARRVRSAILDDGYDAVVLAHGTDALEETAYLTDLLAGPAATRATIVLTAAVRPLDDPASDGPPNLAAALTAAADPALRGAGALACLGGELHAARWVTQVDAAIPAGFSSYPYGPVGRLTGGSVDLLTPPPPRPPAVDGEPESDVALIKTYPGIDPALLTTVVDHGARGVVLEGTGQGNVPVTLLGTIADLTSWDIPVVVASRSRTAATPEPDLRIGAGLAAQVGAIPAHGLPPAKARVALMVALGDGGVTSARRWFDQL